MQQLPSVGRIVHFFPAETDREAKSNANPGPIPAIITRVFNEESGVANMTCFPDNGTLIARSSVPHKSKITVAGAQYWDWPERK